MENVNSTATMLWRGRWLIAGALAVSIALAVVATRLADEVYESRSLVQVDSNVASSTAEVLGLQQASQGLATTYATLLDSPSFLGRIAEDVGDGDLGPAALDASVDSAPVRDGEDSTNLIEVSARAGTAEAAQALADDVTDASLDALREDAAERTSEQQRDLEERVATLSDRIRELGAQAGSDPDAADELASVRAARAELNGQLAALIANGVAQAGNVRVAAPADEPTAPVSPRPMLNLLLGIVLGLMVGVGFAWLRQALDRHVRNSDEIGDLVDLPVLGAIPLRRGASPDDPVIREAYDLLRANLAFLGVESPCRIVTVTSHESGEGKTSVSEGLARASARAGARTVLIDGDVRTRELTRRLGYAVNTGLTDLVAGSTNGAGRAKVNGDGEQRGSRRVRVEMNLALLPAGSSPPNPASLLASQAVEGVLEAAARGADLVVIDTPPVTDLADATLLASHADGAIVVVRAGKTSKSAVATTVASLEQARVRPLGVVVIEPRSVDSAYYPVRERRRVRDGRTPAGV